MYPVNPIAFSGRGIFATAGGDGVVSFWDKEKRSRIKEFKPGPTTCRAAQVQGAQERWIQQACPCGEDGDVRRALKAQGPRSLCRALG